MASTIKTIWKRSLNMVSQNGFPRQCLDKLVAGGPWKIEPIGNQLANRTWVLSNGEKRYLAKQFRYEEAFSRDMEQVLALEHYVAEQSLGPEVVLSVREDRVVIYDYLETSMFDVVHEEELQLRVLGRALAGVQRLTPNLPRWSLRERLYLYCDALEESSPALAKQLKHDLHESEDLLTLWENGPHVFCHLDLSMDHIFLNPHLRIIDWEYAGYSHPAFDVAMAVVMNDLFENEIDVFLDEYNQYSKFNMSREELPDWIRLVALVNRIWFKVQQSLQKKSANSSK
ncbi:MULTISPECIES: aminoglycoside phosphotransferase family protein [Gammaproteobacteria]|uniref:aminoglycoside phosphotransferase family protein n=1 Tax=Gammaproteobacteria TaxID=1236 RepID=UPI000DD0949F|nr:MULTISPECIES: aminoglycoside phosphotransferase family protein [Gammaproteobacteria]RTE85750.1 aminoglycoside phosphotransferase family protein [Aliidiomarina sp. B3213]TCZ90248.1 aminoglycoside phosphotransferase family protein [Lysobacter sp. N42]